MNTRPSMADTFNSPKVRCRHCGDVIFSKFPGQFVACSCDKIAIDATREFTRYIGELSDFEKVEAEDMA